MQGQPSFFDRCPALHKQGESRFFSIWQGGSVMRNLFDLARQPIVIGAFVLALLIVVGSYVGSHWYYGDIEPIDIPEQLTFTPNPPKGGQEPEVQLRGATG